MSDIKSDRSGFASDRQPLMVKTYQLLARNLRLAQTTDLAEEIVQWIIDNCLPHGSGTDTTLYAHLNEAETRLYISSEYHKMNENGYYDGWIPFRVTVIPSLFEDFDIQVKCADPDLREYLSDLFYDSLSEEFDANEMYSALRLVERYHVERSMTE